jgi:glycosyltransferase involved in cell wall biosynthesis
METARSTESALIMTPKVSVVIPAYNRAHKVRQSIDSVLAQTFSDLEVIVVDDGSSDGTGDFISRTYGDRIRYFFQANQGPSAARNRGIEEARGVYIAFLDSDDFWEKEKLEWQFKALERFGTECCACYTDTQLFNHQETRTLFQMAVDSYRHEGGVGVNHEILRLLVRPGGAGMVVHLSSLLAHAEVIRKTGGFKRNLMYSEDSEFMFRLAMLTGFCYVNRPLVWFDRSPAKTRHVGASSVWNKPEFLLQANQRRLEGLLQLSDRLPPNLLEIIRERLSAVHNGWTNWYLETGEYKKAREAALKSARLNLTLNVVVKWVLTWMSPQLALRQIQQRQQRAEDSFTV